ncbi:NAD+ synthase [Falsiroseomonas selenitidurans]|uniref:Glutamine-dependent NAD(+) synthetase n=1 Tax=Falsiroseomonas selenitidurans TaxID=2716335 RepID=A0ABX1E179_9PROT|nr:NAD+ synthase [Falsiroseomonas selenitidurans]NKC29558.1 NAD+ synthase [Falsiroseomonas selenitidurans]
MTNRLRIALAQINPHEGALDANADRIRQARADAAAAGADLLVTPEFSIAGYPPEDLVLKPAFVEACEARIAALAVETADGGPGLVVGGPWRDGDRLHNALFLLEGGRILARRAKHELPNYGVFDDKRVFIAGPAPGPVSFRGVRLGLMICEDWWFPAVSETLSESGAEILISINGSPFEAAKQDTRVQLAVARVVETGLPFVFLNQVCGQDELVFEGASFVLNADRSLAVQMPMFAEQVAITDWTRGESGWACAPQPIPPAVPRLEQIYRAMMLGLRDYVDKNRFPGVVLGLSGGIDSALSAAVAADALGPDRVRAVMMPSPYTSRESLDDAEGCAQLLGIRYESIAIGPAMEAMQGMLAPAFGNRPADTTEENLQSRLRGVTLMALSNKFGDMLLTTGNKSEMSTGYATLYGDMCGGYSVLKDVWKMTVFALSRWRNANLPPDARGPAGPVMPDRVITKPPSAELKPDQTDQDTLPPYEVLDAILEGLVEREMDVDALVAAGHDRATVLRIWRMLDRAEYKRRQAPPGVKITPRAFGRDRRYPLTNGFSGLIA